MKKSAIVLAVASVLTACSSTPQTPAGLNVALYNTQVANQQSAVMNAPEWMSKLPKSPNSVYESATATSNDFGMADMKAKTIAYAKLCTSAGGTVRSQMKMYKADSGDVSQESTELAVRSICPDVDMTGVETVEMRHVAEGSRIRTFVLVALPIGNANVMKTSKNMAKRAPEAFKELDNTAASKINDAESTVKLLDVDNAEYKARRDEALQKPGAVIGEVVVH